MLFEKHFTSKGKKANVNYGSGGGWLARYSGHLLINELVNVEAKPHHRTTFYSPNKLCKAS